MSMGYCNVIILGYLSKDPELRYSPKGAAVCNLTICVNRNWTSEAGEKMSKPSFIDCTAFGKQAEAIAQYLKKGKPLLVEGQLDQQTWDDKQTGQKRSRIVVLVKGFQFIDQGQGGGGAQTHAAPQARPAQPAQQRFSSGDVDPGSGYPPPGSGPDDDVPF